jgi:hypothetical protein
MLRRRLRNSSSLCVVIFGNAFQAQGRKRRCPAYWRPRGKCWISPGMDTQRCFASSQTELIGALNDGSAMVPTVKPIISGRAVARTYTVEPQPGQKNDSNPFSGVRGPREASRLARDRQPIGRIVGQHSERCARALLAGPAMASDHGRGRPDNPPAAVRIGTALPSQFLSLTCFRPERHVLPASSSPERATR